MKLKPRDIDRFIARPDPATRACLLFGADPGLVRERSNKLAIHTLGPLKDNFGLVDLTEAALKNDPALLADEISAISMLADARVVRVQGAGETTARLMTNILQGLQDASVKTDALIIIEAGELTARSKLRKLFESDKQALAIACYRDEGRSLQEVIHAALAQKNLSAEPAAMAAMLASLGADRGLTRSELEKLMLLKGAFGKDFKSGTVTLADVEASMGPGSTSNVDGVIDAALAGLFNPLDRELQTASAENIHPTVILRGLQNHLGRLLSVRIEMEKGGNVRNLMKGLRPPVFFKREQAFGAQVGRWPAKDLKAALGLALDVEIKCKQTGQPDRALCAQALMSIASRAKRLSR